jgi:hypothetical protein
VDQKHIASRSAFVLLYRLGISWRLANVADENETTTCLHRLRHHPKPWQFWTYMALLYAVAVIVDLLAGGARVVVPM